MIDLQTEFSFELSEYISYSIDLNRDMLRTLTLALPTEEEVEREALLIAKTEIMLGIAKELNYIALDVVSASMVADLLDKVEDDKDGYAKELANAIRNLVKNNTGDR